MALLQVDDLHVSFHTRNGVVRAVDGVSFQVAKGQTIGIVGESGSGKSVSCYSLLGLIPQPPGRITHGTAMFDGSDLLRLSERELQKVRGKRISMIFQDPMTSLNPWLRVSQQLIEPLQIHEGKSSREALAEAIEALRLVGIREPEKRIQSYPHEFSGGMRQRVMIAMAMITRPELLIADEPTTALDVTVQKEVLDLMKQRQRDSGTAVIFITHDLGVVAEVCDFVYVMYGGRIVEAATTKDLLRHPRHAYTRALLKSIPALQAKGTTLYTIGGMPPDLSKDIPGCSFSPRRPLELRSQCAQSHRPELVEISAQHWAQNCPGCLAEAG
jgi:oligopeptide transport system ATP-binding protein